MTELTPVPDPPQPPERRPYSYDRWKPQEELQGLAEWVDRLEDFTAEPRLRDMVGIYHQMEEGFMESPRPEIVAVSKTTWETLERESRAYRALRPMVGRLLHFMEGQERALRELRDYRAYHGR